MAFGAADLPAVGQRFQPGEHVLVAHEWPAGVCLGKTLSDDLDLELVSGERAFDKRGRDLRFGLAAACCDLPETLARLVREWHLQGSAHVTSTEPRHPSS